MLTTWLCLPDPALSNFEKTAQPVRFVFLINEMGDKWKALSL